MTKSRVFGTACLVLLVSASSVLAQNDPVIPVDVADITTEFADVVPLIIGGAVTVGALGLAARTIRRLFGWGAKSIG